MVAEKSGLELAPACWCRMLLVVSVEASFVREKAPFADFQIFGLCWLERRPDPPADDEAHLAAASRCDPYYWADQTVVSVELALG